MLIINEAEFNRIREISENKSLVSLEYLTDTQNKLTDFVFKNFFGGDATDPQLLSEAKRKLDILNQTIALPYKICSVKSKFTGKPISGIEVDNLSEAIFSFTYGGSMVFAIDELDEDGNPIINIYNSEQYIKEGNIEKLITYIKGDNLEKYLFVKEFNHVEEPGIIKNSLYRISNGNNGLYGNKINLKSLSITSEFEEVENFGTEEKLLFVAHDFKIKNPLYGTPSLDFIKPMLKSIDIELSNIKDQFIKHLSAKLAIQGIDAAQMPKDEDGNILFREAEAIFLQNGVTKPEYIQNRNDLIKDVILMIDKYIGFAANNLSIPLELVGLSGQVGTESTESKLLRYSDFIKDIEYIRGKIDFIYEGLYYSIIDIKPDYFNEDVTEFISKWKKIMPQDGLKLTQELSLAKTNGFISQRSAVKEYMGLQGEELEDELKQIENEQAKSIDNVSLF